MHPAFASKLKPIKPNGHLPADSAVFTLTRKIDSAVPGESPYSARFLETSQKLREVGYLRTALTYYSLATRKGEEHCLLLEPDGFALETHLIVEQLRSSGSGERLYVGQNPESETWFWVRPQGEDVRALYANTGSLLGGVEIPLHREVSSPTGTGVLLALKRCFEFGSNELMNAGDFRTLKMFRPLASQPARGQMDLFAGAPLQGT